MLNVCSSGLFKMPFAVTKRKLAAPYSEETSKVSKQEKHKFWGITKWDPDTHAQFMTSLHEAVEDFVRKGIKKCYVGYEEVDHPAMGLKQTLKVVLELETPCTWEEVRSLLPFPTNKFFAGPLDHFAEGVKLNIGLIFVAEITEGKLEEEDIVYYPYGSEKDEKGVSKHCNWGGRPDALPGPYHYYDDDADTIKVNENQCQIHQTLQRICFHIHRELILHHGVHHRDLNTAREASSWLQILQAAAYESDLYQKEPEPQYHADALNHSRRLWGLPA